MGNALSPVELPLVDGFYADGVGDYNWGMVGAAIKTKAKGLYRKALRVRKEGV
jgi:hypothetical protein